MNEEKRKVARLSILSNLTLVVFKLVVGITIHSVSIMSEAIHSGLDLLAALMAYFAVIISGKPPDEEHEYGHGKIENVSGVIEAILILIAAVWIIYEAISKLTTGGRVVAPVWGLVVMGVSGLLNFFISGKLMKTAKSTESVALEADAWHLRTDVYTSIGVALGLLLLMVTGYNLIDPIIALVVAILILRASLELIVKAFTPLLDTKLPPEEEETIKQIILEYGQSCINFHDLRTRKAGSERHIDLHLVVPAKLNIAISHQICDKIENAVQEKYRDADILIHVEPCSDGDDCLACPDPCKERQSQENVKKGL